MPAQVVRIRDGYVQPTGTEPDEDLVKFLEELLERARSGDIVGVAGAASAPSPVGSVQPTESFRAGWSISVGMVGALEDVKYRILRDMNDDV
jgi:hypothetical protein